MKYLEYLKLFFDENDGSNDGANGGSNNSTNNGTNNENSNKNSTNNGTSDNDGNNGSNDDKNTNNDDDRTKPKYSDDDLDKILGKKFARWQKEQKKATDEAARLATMTAQERAEHERDELQKELDELKRANLIADMEKQARQILKADDVDIDDSLVSMLVAEDADETSSNVKAFAKAFKKAVQEEVKKQLSHKKPNTGSTGNLTKDEILKEKDPMKRQQMIKDNISLFKN